jgi:purine nucleosidase
MYIIDTDPGLDDAHAIAMATKLLPHDRLVVTTVAGNVGLDAVLDNAAWLLDELAPSVPLYRGAAGPLVGSAVDAAHIHGADGLGGFPHARGRTAPQREHAAVAIAELARAQAGALHIIALGPLTNLALALALEPALPDLVASVTIMGGSPAQHGNASMNAEYNVYADAHAAEAVFSRMRRISLLTWDASLSTRFTRAELDAFWSGPSVQARVLRDLAAHRFSADADYASSADFGRADPLAMAVALRPECVASARAHRVHVVHDTGLAHGVTVVDERDATSDRHPVRIVESLHREPLLDALTV